MAVKWLRGKVKYLFWPLMSPGIAGHWCWWFFFCCNLNLQQMFLWLIQIQASLCNVQWRWRWRWSLLQLICALWNSRRDAEGVKIDVIRCCFCYQPPRRLVFIWLEISVILAFEVINNLNPPVSINSRSLLFAQWPVMHKTTLEWVSVDFTNKNLQSSGGGWVWVGTFNIYASACAVNAAIYPLYQMSFIR